MNSKGTNIDPCGDPAGNGRTEENSSMRNPNLTLETDKTSVSILTKKCPHYVGMN